MILRVSLGWGERVFEWLYLWEGKGKVLGIEREKKHVKGGAANAKNKVGGVEKLKMSFLSTSLLHVINIQHIKSPKVGPNTVRFAYKVSK